MSEPFSYDEVMYPSMVFPHIRPDQIGAISILHGVKPDDIDRCKVLELGCGDGTNLLSIAYTMPNSHCVGVDLSAPRIEEAKSYADTLGLSNIEFHHQDLLEFEPEKYGTFDFIVAHGIYSWVPELVREKIPWIYAQCLKPNGVGFISYNAYPGWHVREVARHAMQFQTELIDSPLEKVANGLRFVEFLSEASSPDPLYKSLLSEQLTYLEKKVPESIFHDDLGTFNQPFYFRQFVERIEGSGLQFVSELEPMSFFIDDLPLFAQTALEKVWDDTVRREQYLDFIRGRFFRSTLVCQRTANPSYRPIPENLSSLYFSSSSLPISSESSLTDNSSVAFSAPKDKEFQTDHPAIKSLLALLGSNWPRRFSFLEIQAFLESGSVHSEIQLEVLQDAIVRLINASILEPRCFCPQVALSVSERPKVSDFARWQAGRGFATGKNLGVTNMHGSDIQIEVDLVRDLILLTDGTRDREGLAAGIREHLALNPSDLAAVEPHLEDMIDSNLEMLRRSALLVS